MGKKLYDPTTPPIVDSGEITRIAHGLNRDALPADILTEIKAALAYHPGEDHAARITRAQFEGLLFCNEGETPQKVGRHPESAAAE